MIDAQAERMRVLEEALERIANDPHPYGQRIQRFKAIARAALARNEQPALGRGEG